MNYKFANSLGDFINTQKLLSNLELDYPSFNSWFWNKVIPNLNESSLFDIGTKIILLENKQELVGVSIIKRSINENKLCALRVIDKHQSKGLGIRLLDKSLKELNCDKPLCSVSQTMVNDYSRIFINRYNFDLTYVYKDLYKKQKLEYEVNGSKSLNIKTEY